MTTKNTNRYSHVLASALVVALLGCNGLRDSKDEVGTDPARPVATALPEPVVGYNCFEPRDEEDVRAHSNYGYLIAKAKDDFDAARFKKMGMEVLGSFAANGAKYYHLHTEGEVTPILRDAKLTPGLIYIEPEVMHYMPVTPDAEFEQEAPDFVGVTAIDYDNADAYVADHRQYGVYVTHTVDAWKKHGFGPNRPVVADIDTGVRWQHDDLEGVVRHAFTWYKTGNNKGELDNLGPDTEPVDRLAEEPGYATGTDEASGHGTHTAGTIAAVGNNGKGVAGMCWNVDLVSYKGLSDAGSGGSWAIYGSLWHLAKWKKANYPHTIVANFSLGGAFANQFGIDMVELALENDILMVCSSGNDYAGISTFPGSYTGVVRVGATEYRDRRVNFSNRGKDLSVVAPGSAVWSLGRGSNASYSSLSGTSMAAPHVTGLVGYMLTFAPDLKPDQIKTYLEKNADLIGGAKGHTSEYGWGRINTLRTIDAVVADLKANTAPASDYVLSPIKIKAEYETGEPANGMSVYLYNCNAAGTITNYAASSLTGPSYHGIAADPDAGLEDGVAWFNMLKPGYYKAIGTLAVLDIGEGRDVGYPVSTEVFEVRRGVPVPEKVLRGFPVFDTLTIQTYPTSNTARQGGDTCIQVFNAIDGAPVITYDSGEYDTLRCALPKKPGTYWIRIYPYQTAYGEYALWLSTTGDQPSPAPGTFDDPGPDGVRGSQAFAQAAAQEIGINDRVVYGDMTAENGASGDWYKFVVE